MTVLSLAAPMHWNATDERYHEALRRLAMVLLALAVITDRVACRAWPVRSLVLWLLSRAETRARDFAARLGAVPLPAECSAWSPGGVIPAKVRGGFASGIAEQGDRAGPRYGEMWKCSSEAARLAQAFRALAAVLFALSRQPPQWLRTARRHCRPLASGRNAAHLGRLSFANQRSYIDTS
jgi:hypothetical protein